MNIYKFIQRNKYFFKKLWNDIGNKNVSESEKYVKENYKKLFKDSFEDLILTTDYDDSFNILFDGSSSKNSAVDIRFVCDSDYIITSLQIEFFDTTYYFNLFNIIIDDIEFRCNCTNYFLNNCDYDYIDNDSSYDIIIDKKLDLLEGSLSFPHNPNIDILDIIDDTLNREKFIFVDMDHTLCNPNHRSNKLPHILSNYESLSKDKKISLWENYFSGCKDDPPITEIISLVKSLGNNNIIILTARDESARDETIEWLEKYDIKYMDLLMRQVGDESPANQIKLQYIEKMWLTADELLIIDDDIRNVELFRKHGYHVVKPCVQHIS